jgi:hypothetical protein
MSQPASCGRLTKFSAELQCILVCFSGMPNKSRFSSIKAQARRDLSTKAADSAPREMASMPIAPVPAHKSKNLVCSLIPGARMLKSVSRRRSEVGRVLLPDGLRRIRPRYKPEIILILKFAGSFQKVDRQFTDSFRIIIEKTLQTIWKLPANYLQTFWKLSAIFSQKS